MSFFIIQIIRVLLDTHALAEEVEGLKYQLLIGVLVECNVAYTL